MALTKLRGNTQIKSATVTNVEIAANAGIELSKLAEGAELIKRDGSVAFTGNLNLDGNKVTNVGTPTSSTDAANMNYVDVEVAAVQAEVDAEELARAAADTQLQSNIDAEALARANADTTLQGNIDSEASARAAADTQLQSNIDAEAATRLADDNTLQSNIDAEAEARAAADSALDSRMTTAEGDIVALDGRMDTAEADIDSLESRASTLENGLQAETSARIADVDAEEARAMAAEGVLTQNLASEVSRATAAEGVLQSNIDAEAATRLANDNTLQSNINAEAATRLANDNTLQSNINAEAATRADADTALDGRLVKAEDNLAFPQTTLFENNSGVYQDGRPGVRDSQLRDGWYFKNSVAGQKINWYVYDGSVNNVALQDFSVYAIVTMDTTNRNDAPFFNIYTTKTGTGDYSSWYRSRRTVGIPLTGVTIVAGKKYLMYYGTNPNVHTDLPRIQLTATNFASTGPLGGTERVLFTSLGSNSASPVNAVQFVAESLGVNAPSYKMEFDLDIRVASQVDLDTEAATRLANDNTLQSNINAEAAARQAADANLQSQIDAMEASSNGDFAALQARMTTAEGDIDSLEARMATAEGEIDVLQSGLAQEILDRQSGDAATLASAQSYADQKISDLVDGAPQLLDTLNELAAAIGNDENFAVTLTNSVAAVQAELDAEEARALAAEAAIQAELDAEEARALAAEGVLQDNIDAEEARALAAEAAIQAELDAEEARAMAAESALQVEIDAEEIARAAADAALDARLVIAEADIVALEGRMDSAEGRLDVVESDLAAEIARATGVEQDLQDQMDAEVARATAAEQVLDSRMTTAEGDIVALEGRMDSAEGRLDDLEALTVYIADVVTRETPSGAVDGSNQEFVLAHSVVLGSEQVFLNGLLQEPGVGNDYTIVGSVISFNNAPMTNDRVRVNYLKNRAMQIV